MSLKKKFMLVAITTLISLIMICKLSIFPTSIKASADDFIIVIDPGHGGIDVGVTGATGSKEAVLNLSLSKNLRDYFYSEGKTVVLTRTTDAGLYGNLTSGFKNRDLKKRVEIATQSNADLFISIHMNKYKDTNRRGGQVFYKSGCDNSKKLAQLIQDQLNGLKEATRECSPLPGDYYVLNNSPCPSVIVECGFLSNKEDEALLTTEEYRQKIAYCIFYATIVYLDDLT